MFRFRSKIDGDDPPNRIEPEFGRERGSHGRPAGRWDDPHARASVLPQVTEGNSDADWQLWEQAMRELDHEMQERRRERVASAGGESGWEKWLRR